MLRRMDLEEERRNQAEEKVAETAEATKKAAEAALTWDPFDPRAAAFSAEPVELIDHHVMGKGRMKKVEGWHTFLETLSLSLALQEEPFVRELQLCVPVKTEILQTKLPLDTAARSSKLFYYLTPSLAKWERGLELPRSCSKRQGMSACGYEVVRTITLSEPRSVRAPFGVCCHVLFLSSRGRPCPFQDLLQLSRRASSAALLCLVSLLPTVVTKDVAEGSSGPREVAKSKLLLVVRETLPESLPVVAFPVENHVQTNFRAEALQ